MVVHVGNLYFSLGESLAFLETQFKLPAGITILHFRFRHRNYGTRKILDSRNFSNAIFQVSRERLFKTAERDFHTPLLYFDTIIKDIAPKRIKIQIDLVLDPRICNARFSNNLHEINTPTNVGHVINAGTY